MKQRTFLVCMAAALVAACGGGGSDNNTTPSAAAFDLNAAMAGLLTQGMSFNALRASASISAPSAPIQSLAQNSYELALSWTPTTPGPQAAGGESLAKSVFTSSMTKNGAPLSTGSATYYYRLNPTQFVTAARSDGQVATYTTPGGLPSAALVGQSGTFNSFSINGANGMTTWSLEAATSTTAWACLSSITGSAASSGEKYCYRISADGAVLEAKVTLTVDGRSLTFTGGGASSVPTPANAAPSANAGAEQAVQAGAQVTLDGSASSDANNDPLTYAWVVVSRPAGSAAALNNPSSAKPSFRADALGTYKFSLVVNDGKVSSTASTVTVVATDDAPVALAGQAQTVPGGTLVNLDGSASFDPNNNPLTYTWAITSRPSGSAATLSNPKSAKPSFTADQLGTYTLSLVVNDGWINSAPSTVTVVASNAAPVAFAGPDRAVTVGSLVNLDGSASTDPNNNPLTYSWVMVSKPGGSLAALSSATSAKPSFTADKLGAYTLSLVVNDGWVSSAPTVVNVTATDGAPVAFAGYPQKVVVGSVVKLDGSGSSDPENHTLTYAWTLVSRPLGSSASLSSATAAKPTFTADVAGTYTASLVVNDGWVSSTASTVTITAGANTAPVANAGAAQNVVTGALVTLDGSSSYDPEADSITYSWVMTSKPAGSAATLSSATSVRPTFTADVAGAYQFSLTVNDGKLNSTASVTTVSAVTVNKLFVTDVSGCIGLTALTCTGTPLTLPASITVDKTCAVDGCTLGQFRLFASGKSFTITQVQVANLTAGSTVVPAFLGLIQGQIIAAGETVVYSVLATPAPAVSTILTFKITVDTGDTLLYTVKVN